MSDRDDVLTEAERNALDDSLVDSGCHGFQGDHPDLYRAVARIKAEARAEALDDAAHEIEHSVAPHHPNAGYRDGHAHAAWVVRSLIHRAALDGADQ